MPQPKHTEILLDVGGVVVSVCGPLGMLLVCCSMVLMYLLDSFMTPSMGNTIFNVSSVFAFVRVSCICLLVQYIHFGPLAPRTCSTGFPLNSKRNQHL